MKKLKTE